MRIEAFGDRRFIVEGSPADCVLAATGDILKGNLPDLVLSGVNRGHNVAEDTLYSGTVGGAIVGNAGCYGHEIGEFLVEATVLRRDGRIQTLGPEDFAFAYRTSALKERGDIVLELALQLARGDLAEASRVRAEHLADRRRKHPWDIPCAGSYFQNLPPAAPGERRRDGHRECDGGRGLESDEVPYAVTQPPDRQPQQRQPQESNRQLLVLEHAAQQRHRGERDQRRALGDDNGERRSTPRIEKRDGCRKQHCGWRGK